MKLKIGIISLWLCMLFGACYEDKGNYDLVDYNKITITSVSALSKTTVILGDTVEIVPKITWKYPDRDTMETAFEYVWKIGAGVDTISRERNLSYVPQECGTFSYYLYVREIATGVITRLSVTVTVNTPYAVGWIIGSNINGQPALSYIRRDSRVNEEDKTVYYWTDYVDLYAQLHPDDPLGPGKLTQAMAYIIGNYDDEVIVFQEGGKATILNGLDFGKFLNLEDEFPGATYPAGFIPKSFVRGGYCDFVLGENGDLYWRRNSATTELAHEQAFIDIPVYFPDGGAEISRFMDIRVYSSEYVLMFDELHNRFLACYTSYSSGNNYLGGKMTIINNTDPNEFANILNLTGYKLIYCGDHIDGKNIVNILKEESTGNYIYQSFKFTTTTTSLTVASASQEVFAGSSYVTDNTVFWRIRSSSYLYFGEGSKLYFYDVNTKQVKLYTDFGSGRITHLSEDAVGSVLGVALDNGNFYLIDAIDAATLGAADPGAVGILHHASGLGEIESLSWKWGGHYRMVFSRY